jgi:hypothetical protein
MSRAEATAINGFVDLLNGALRDTVNELNAEVGWPQFRVVPVAQAFQGKELCIGGSLNPNSALNSIKATWFTWPGAYDNLSASFHPTAEGQKIYADAFAAAMASRISRVVTVPGGQAASASIDVADGANSITVRATKTPGYELALTGPNNTSFTASSAGVTSGESGEDVWLTVPSPTPAGQWRAELRPARSGITTMSDGAPASPDSISVRLTLLVDDAVPAPTAKGSVRQSAPDQWTFEAANLRPGDTATWAFGDGSQLTGSSVTRTVGADEVAAAILTVTGADGQTSSADVVDPAVVPPPDEDDDETKGPGSTTPPPGTTPPPDGEDDDEGQDPDPGPGSTTTPPSTTPPTTTPPSTTPPPSNTPPPSTTPPALNLPMPGTPTPSVRATAPAGSAQVGQVPAMGAPQVGSIRVGATSVRVARGSTVKIPVIAYSGSSVSGKMPVTWRKSGSAIKVAGTASSAGSVKGTLGKPVMLSIKGVKTGTTTLRVASGGKKATIKVKVVPRAERATSISISAKMLGDGKTAIFQASITPSGATGMVPQWKSSRPSVATIDATGKLTAKKKGKTVVTATIKGAKTRMTVGVD